MVATYTDKLRLTKQGTGDNPNTWGSVLNTQVIDLVGEAIAGVQNVDITGSSNVALTTNNGSADTARSAVLELTGTLGANIELHVPASEKTYFIRGAWTGAFTVDVKISGAGSSVTMRTGEKKIVYIDGTDIYDMVDIGLSVTSNDTTPGDLDDKLTVSNPITKTEVNDGSNETLNLDLLANYNLSGLGLQGGQSMKPSGSSTTDIDFLTGAYSAEDGTFMNLASDITKELDGAWAVGDAAGGLATGTVTVSTVYYCFIIHNPTSGATDALFSLSRTSPTLPTGYTKKRLVGFIRTDVSALIEEWNIVWSSFGPFTAPTVWQMINTDSSNNVTQMYLVFGTNPALTGSRQAFTSAGAINADDDITAFASS